MVADQLIGAWVAIQESVVNSQRGCLTNEWISELTLTDDY